MPEAGMQGQGGQFAAMGGYPAPVIERAEFGQKGAGLGKRPFGWRGQEVEIVAAPER